VGKKRIFHREKCLLCGKWSSLTPRVECFEKERKEKKIKLADTSPSICGLIFEFVASNVVVPKVSFRQMQDDIFYLCLLRSRASVSLSHCRWYCRLYILLILSTDRHTKVKPLPNYLCLSCPLWSSVPNYWRRLLECKSKKACFGLHFTLGHISRAKQTFSTVEVYKVKTKPRFEECYTCLWCETKMGVVRILVIFQDRPMFSYITQKFSVRAFHWCGWT